MVEALPGLITAVVALIAAMGAIWQNKQGRKDAARQAAAARELEKREQIFTESESALEAHKALGATYREEITRLNAERDAERERYTVHLKRKDEQLCAVRSECTHVRKDLASMVTVLSNSLRNDVHLEMVTLGLKEAELHAAGHDDQD